MTPKIDLLAHPTCKTSVVFCVANSGGHWWWSNDTFDGNSLMDLIGQGALGARPRTFEINKQIIDFFDRNGVID